MWSFFILTPMHSLRKYAIHFLLVCNWVKFTIPMTCLKYTSTRYEIFPMFDLSSKNLHSNLNSPFTISNVFNNSIFSSLLISSSMKRCGSFGGGIDWASDKVIYEPLLWLDRFNSDLIFVLPVFGRGGLLYSPTLRAPYSSLLIDWLIWL